MLGTSPLFREGIIHDLGIVSFMYYDLPIQDADQIDLPISPFVRYYIKYAPLHPNDDHQIVIRTEREKLKTFYSINAQPKMEVWSRKKITRITGFR